MKKLLILILIVLLGTMAYMLAFKNIEIGTWKSTNIEELKGLNEKLKTDINKASELNETTYTTRIDELNQSIRNLTISKETYENKIKSINEEIDLGVVSVKKYKIEYLWTKLENYAKNRNVWMKLDLIENGASGSYNLNITLKGGYIDITDVIFDIEKDDTLDFTVEEFKMIPTTSSKTTTNTSNSSNKSNTVTSNTPTLPNDSGTIKPSDANKNNTANNNTTNNNNNNNTSSSTQTTIVADPTVLQATFSIKNVKIELN